jgi:hypothetical protein
VPELVPRCVESVVPMNDLLHCVGMTPLMFTPSAFSMCHTTATQADSLTIHCFHQPSDWPHARTTDRFWEASDCVPGCVPDVDLVDFLLPEIDNVRWYFMSPSIFMISSGFPFLLGGLFLPPLSYIVFLYIIFALHRTLALSCYRAPGLSLIPHIDDYSNL